MVTFQEILQKLSTFWAAHGCILHQGYDMEMGAGTFNPATFLRCLGPEPYRAASIEPCRRPADGRYGENPNRLQHFFQYQVILKPSPLNMQELYLESLEALGFNLKEHDIRFVHDDWESPTLGAWGLGWEVWIDGMEVTQYTYFQNVGGIALAPITGELSYGIERLAMYLQGVNSIFDIQWSHDLTYGDIYQRGEYEFSGYNFDHANVEMWRRHFEDYENEATRLLDIDMPLPAYDMICKASHAFNMLEARGVISVTERTGIITRIRTLACAVATAYVKSREEQAHPLLSCFKQSQENEEHLTPVTHAISHPLLVATDQMHDDYLVEIGCEELPAAFVPIGCAGLEKLLRETLDKEKISYSAIDMYGTPRRIAAYIRGLAMARPEVNQRRRGPEINAAFDAEGNPRPAGIGFMRALQIAPLTLDAIRKGDEPTLSIATAKGKAYLFASIVTPKRATADLLAETLPEIILSLPFPKKMRWNSLDIEYARPLRWIVSLFGKHTVPFTVGNITACRESFGHRQLHPWAFALVKAQDYLALLRDHYVIADINERRKSIQTQLDQLEKEIGGTILARDRLMNEVVHLVEWPHVTHSTFDSQYLKAPKEVLISEMVEHQKYFPVEKEDGTLKNAFVITANTLPTGYIREGNQRALSSRLADGVALYEQDLRVPFDSWNAKLQAVTFQKTLGSLYDKVERLIAHARYLQQLLSLSTPEKAATAALYSKSDLASRMIFEFPDLQGTMGKYYAEAHGLDPEVALAIEEHWQPRGDKAPLPTTETGIIVSLADKIDNLLGCFAVNLIPTSSSDPYALRRQVLGIIKILIDNGLSLPIKEVLTQCWSHFPSQIQKENSTPIAAICDFFVNRIKTIFIDYGFKKDEIEASVSFGFRDIYDSYCKVGALHTFRNTGDQFPRLFEVYKRAKGQLQAGHQSATGTVTPTLFKEEAERALYHHLTESAVAFDNALINRRYDDAYSLIAAMQPLLATLFDEVKILCDEPTIKNNRLALLNAVFKRFSLLLDFAKIQD